MVCTVGCAGAGDATGDVAADVAGVADGAPPVGSTAASWAPRAGANTRSTKMAAVTRMDTLILREGVGSCPTLMSLRSAVVTMLNCIHRIREGG